MIGAKVDVGRGWGREFAARVNAEVRVAVAEASERGAQVAAAAAQPRRRTGRMADIRPVEVIGTPDGWEGGFASPAFYAPFQSSGTNAARRRKVTASTLRRRESPAGRARQARVGGSAGITPLGFLEKGRSEARRELVRLLNNL